MWRVEADGTGPVAFDGRVRVRVDIAKQDQHSWLDRAYTDRTVLFGTLEADLSSSTLLTVSNTYTQVDELPPEYSLPDYLSGAPLDLPRSTCLCFTWGTQNNADRILDAILQQKIGSNWDIKLSTSRQRQSQLSNEPDLYGAINNYTGAGLTLSSAEQSPSVYTSTTGDLKVSGAFDLFGRRQEVYLGANYEKDQGTSDTYNYDIPAGGIPFDVFNFNPNSIPQPSLSNSVFEYVTNGQKQYGANVGFTLSFIDPLKLMFGVRWQRYDFNEYLALPGIFSLGPSTPKDSYAGPSYAALTWAFNPQLTSYISWADVLQSNFGELEPNGQTVAPTHGGTYEAGLKFKQPGGVLNASAALYYTDLKNVALFTGPGTGGDGFLSGCCYSTDNNERELSYGATFQVAGQVVSGWQATFSWQYNVNRYTGSDAGTSERKPIAGFQPRNVLKLWNTYTPQLPGWNRFNAGIGVTAQSTQTNLGTACSVFAANPAEGCAPTGTTPFVYKQPSYALVNLKLGYKLSQNWELTANVDNLFNRLYLSEFLNNNFFNQYGAPLTWKFGVHGKY
jgi:outer membrane receptor for ferric coprogen and ferric-rhodotorulic acid